MNKAEDPSIVPLSPHLPPTGVESSQPHALVGSPSFAGALHPPMHKEGDACISDVDAPSFAGALRPSGDAHTYGVEVDKNTFASLTTAALTTNINAVPLPATPLIQKSESLVAASTLLVEGASGTAPPTAAALAARGATPTTTDVYDAESRSQARSAVSSTASQMRKAALEAAAAREAADMEEELQDELEAIRKDQEVKRRHRERRQRANQEWDARIAVVGMSVCLSV